MNNKKSIVYIWKSPYPWDIRVEKICTSLSKKYNVIILARWSGENLKEETIDGIKIIRVGFNKASYNSTPFSANPLWKKELRSVVEKYNINLIIVREIMLGTLAGKIALIYKIPVVMDMAENYPAVIKLFKHYKTNLLRNILFHKLNIAERVERKSLELIKNIIVVIHEQIDRIKGESFYNDHNMIILENSPLLDDYQLPKRENKLVFGHHGNLTLDKNIFKFLEAVIELLDEGLDIEFHILGKGEVYEETKEIIEKSNHADKLILYGSWGKKQFEKYLNSISYGVLPYELNDFTNTTNFNKFYDFLKAGLPIITSKTAPMKRMIEDLECGLTFDIYSKESIKNTIKELLDKNYNNMAGNSRNAYLEKYNWNNEEIKLLKYVEEII